MSRARGGSAAALLAVLCALLLLLSASAQAPTGSGNNTLNPGNFVPGGFVPNARVLGQHTAPLRPNNQFEVPEHGDEWQDYWVGLAVVPLIVLSAMVLWCCGMCASLTCCCRCAHRTDTQARMIGFGVFVALCVGSIVAWSMLLAMQTQLQSSTNGVLASVLEVQGIVQSWDRVFTDANNTLAAIRAAADAVAEECPPEYVSAVADSVRELSAPAAGLLDDTQQLLDGLDDGLQSVVDSRAHEAVSKSLIAWASVMLVLTVFFLGSVALHFTAPCGKSCKPLRSCVSRLSCVTMFTVGLLLLTVTVLIVGGTNFASSIGADICSPEPDANIQRAISQITNAPQLATERNVLEAAARGESLRLCAEMPGTGDGATAVQDSARVLCFYQTCRGSSVVSDAVDKLNELQQQSVPPAPPGECNVAATVLAATIATELSGVVSDVVSEMRCARLNPVYQAIVYEAGCTRFVEETILVWQRMLMGAALLLAALSVYTHFYLHKPLKHRFDGKLQLYGQSHTNDADYPDSDDDAASRGVATAAALAGTAGPGGSGDGSGSGGGAASSAAVAGVAVHGRHAPSVVLDASALPDGVAKVDMQRSSSEAAPQPAPELPHQTSMGSDSGPGWRPPNPYLQQRESPQTPATPPGPAEPAGLAAPSPASWSPQTPPTPADEHAVTIL